MKREEEAKIYCYSCIERIRGFGCRKYCLNYQRKLIGKEILSLWTEKSGVASSTILASRKRPIKPETVMKIVQALGIKVEEII